MVPRRQQGDSNGTCVEILISRSLSSLILERDSGRDLRLKYTVSDLSPYPPLCSPPHIVLHVGFISRFDGLQEVDEASEHWPTHDPVISRVVQSFQVARSEVRVGLNLTVSDASECYLRFGK